MYEEHFGLNSRPFGAKAEGKAVFVGPSQTKAIARVQKGLALGDAVATVTGMVGVGKTTVVTRSLELIEKGRVVIWIGRMQLAPDELMSLLLAGFGVSSQIKGTVRKFAAFKRLLHERAATIAPVAIVVEDAQRVGVDALAELEALTAADTGDGGAGANIVLMGKTSLNEFLLEPELARLKQRMRLRQQIEPLSAAEVQGYLKHCIREAGGDYDLIFDTGVADLVFKCTGGIPRVINNVCEAALTEAMEQDSTQVTTALLAQVATESSGYIGAASADVVATTQDENIENDLVDSPEAKAAPLDELESPDKTFQNESDIAASSIEDDIATANDAAAVASAAAELTAPGHDEIADTAADEVAASTDSKPEIDWEAIAPPPPANRQDRNEQTISTKDSSDESASARELIVESGNHPNIDEVISASGCEVKDEHAVQESVAALQSEIPDVSATVSPSDSPIIESSAIPELINDTQPELRTLPDITDEHALAKSIPPSPESAKSAADTQTEIPTLVPGIESTQSLKALDPATLPEDTIAKQEAPNSEESQKEDEPLDLDAALSVETESTNVMEGITPDLDAMSSAIEKTDPESSVTELTAADGSNATKAEPVPTTDPVKSSPKSDELGEIVTAQDDAETGDTTTSLELPTLSDSMRIAISLEESYAIEMADVAAEETAAAVEKDAIEIPAESPPLSDAEVVPTLDAENNASAAQQEVKEPEVSPELSSASDPAVEADLALDADTDSAIDTNDAEAGIFDELDPLPDFDAIDEAAMDAELESSNAPFTEDDGAISVTNLTIANNFDKSKNDIDALEAALEAAKQVKISAPTPINHELAAELDSSTPAAEAEPAATADAIDIPQITLDDQLTKQQPTPAELEKLAQEIGTADSLEDFSASMAETLFGSDAFNQIAAAVVANPPPADESPVALNENASPVQLDEREIPAAANDKDESLLTLESTGERLPALEPQAESVLTLEPEDLVPPPATSNTDHSPVALKPEVSAKPVPSPPVAKSKPFSTPSPGDMPLNESMAMRIDILNKARDNVAGMAVENVELGESKLTTTADGLKSPKPEPIENQINTSITQTLKALDVAKMAAMEKEEEEEIPKKKSGGFFSRFRKSS